ncbi:unnamed protein product [Schistosoma mattheei]|uniref:Uncharacterized protein n=1 Tax=Schistosoma mattheei TaxID=31246 RepID=A0A3P8HU09_9TREM|nr:unnamed protein product [Schistosoma mattheei]
MFFFIFFFFDLKVVFDLNSIGLNSFYYNSKLWKTQYTNHLTHKIQINKNNHLLSISNIDYNHNINKSESSYHSSVTMPNILIIINSEKKSIIDWQQQKSLYELMNDLLKKMIDILHNKQLLSITSPETNLLQIDNDDVTNKLINQSRMILTTWYSNPLKLKKLIIKKIEMLKKLIHKFNDLYPDKEIS